VAAFALNRLSALTGDERYAEAARKTVELFYAAMQRQPIGFATLLQALDELLLPPSTLIVRGQPETVNSWTQEIGRHFRPDTLVLGIANPLSGLPAVLAKPLRPASATGWLCRGAVCLEPVDDFEALEQALQ